MSNAKIVNLDNCFCQSQYCRFKKDNTCTKYDKRIIGTSLCEGFEEKDDYWKGLDKQNDSRSR